LDRQGRSEKHELDEEPILSWQGRNERSGVSKSQGVEGMLALASELFAYMGARKKWWLLPIFLVLLLFGGLLILAQGSAVAPFIYTIF
jgi:hypothetical protein